MHKTEAVKQLGNRTEVKFLMILAPPLIYMWKFDDDGYPTHQVEADNLGLLDYINKGFQLKQGVRVGYAKVVGDDFKLNKIESLSFKNAKPSPEEFEAAINSDVIIL